MNTLGFEDDIKISKQEIAKIQLVEAINLFLCGKYLCAITLAGAAEEILARLINQQGKPSVIEESFEAIQAARKKNASIMSGMPRNEIFNYWNTSRNILKHHGKTSDEFVTINLFDEAYWMILRGLTNAKNLEIHIRNQTDFENWLIININL